MSGGQVPGPTYKTQLSQVPQASPATELTMHAQPPSWGGREPQGSHSSSRSHSGPLTAAALSCSTLNRPGEAGSASHCPQSSCVTQASPLILWASLSSSAKGDNNSSTPGVLQNVKGLNTYECSRHRYTNRIQQRSPPTVPSFSFWNTFPFHLPAPCLPISLPAPAQSALLILPPLPDWVTPGPVCGLLSSARWLGSTASQTPARTCTAGPTASPSRLMATASAQVLRPEASASSGPSLTIPGHP